MPCASTVTLWPTLITIHQSNSFFLQLLHFNHQYLSPTIDRAELKEFQLFVALEPQTCNCMNISIFNNYYSLYVEVKQSSIKVSKKSPSSLVSLSLGCLSSLIQLPFTCQWSPRQSQDDDWTYIHCHIRKGSN